MRSLEALGAIRRVHLPQDEFELGSQPQDPEHLDLAPYVLGAVAAINRLLAFMVAEFPAPPEEESEEGDDLDFDLEFDLVDGPGGEGGLSTRAHHQRPMTPEEEAADAAHAFGSMLRSRVVRFGERLQMAHSTGDSWKLLSELDDFKHRLNKAVQGVLFGVLAVFNNTASREEILPEYRSAVGEAVALRTAITDLSYHINRFNESLTDPDIAVPLMVGVSDRLTRFSGLPVYRSLRAEDKKAVIDFRGELYQMRYNRGPDGNVSMSRLRQVVEGFSKFLESMQAINHREVLVLHDRNALQTALARAQEITNTAASDEGAARQGLDALVASLRDVTGRNPDLDAWLRQYRQRDGHPPVGQDLQELTALLQQTASVVG